MAKQIKPKQNPPKETVRRISDMSEYVSRKAAYDDSLSTYTDSIKNHRKLIAIGMQKTGSRKPDKDELDEMLVNGGTQQTVSHDYTDETGKDVSRKAKLSQRTSSKIAPVKTNTYLGKSKVDKDGVSYQQEIIAPIYKAPRERIELVQELKRTDKPAADKVLAKKAKQVNTTQRLAGGSMKRVASSKDKYNTQREYSTYEKNTDAKLVEDKFKKDTINRRKKILNKSNVKVLPKNSNKG